MSDQNVKHKINAKNQLAIDIANKCGLSTKNLISLTLSFEALNLPIITLKYNLPEEIEENIKEVFANFELNVKEL
jgi:hypothetical protein